MAEPQQGMRRRYVRWNEQTAVPPPQLSSNADQEARAFIAGYRACAQAMQGLVRDTNSEVGSALARIAAQTA